MQAAQGIPRHHPCGRWRVQCAALCFPVCSLCACEEVDRQEAASARQKLMRWSRGAQPLRMLECRREMWLLAALGQAGLRRWGATRAWLQHFCAK